MAEVRFLPSDKLPAWLEALSRERQVVAPVAENGSTVFRAYTPGSPLRLERIPTTPPKGIIFPQSEDILRTRARKNPDDLSKVEYELIAPLPATKRVIVGARPCDARGFLLLDAALTGGRFRDPIYAARRANTVLVTLGCATPDRSCFCHWTGGGPFAREGSDVLLTPVEGGYAAEALTKAGAKLLDPAFFAEAPDKALAAEAVEEAARGKLGEAPDLAGAAEGFAAAFEDAPLWEELTAGCLSCGACAYTCPTCSCFNITDEQAGLTSRRIRTWDNCMSFLYSLEASGHNPRAQKAQRMRNRVGHKLAYHASRHPGDAAAGAHGFSCVGCGRCIRNCPADMDIRAAMLRFAKAARKA